MRRLLDRSIAESCTSIDDLEVCDWWWRWYLLLIMFISLVHCVFTLFWRLNCQISPLIVQLACRKFLALLLLKFTHFPQTFIREGINRLDFILVLLIVVLVCIFQIAHSKLTCISYLIITAFNNILHWIFLIFKYLWFLKKWRVITTCGHISSFSYYALGWFYLHILVLISVWYYVFIQDCL